MDTPALSNADRDLQDRLLREQLLGQAQLRQLLAARDQAWDAACEAYTGIYCGLSPGCLRLSEFPSGRQLAEFTLEHTDDIGRPGRLIFVDPADGRLLCSEDAPEDPGLLITAAGSFWLSADPCGPSLLGQTPQLHGSGALDSDLLVAGDLLFVSERRAGRLRVISLRTHRQLTSLQLREPGSPAPINLTVSESTGRAFVTDQQSSRLWILDLGSWHLMPLQTGLGTLGNLWLAPDPNFLFLSVLEPVLRLVYFDLQSLSVIQDLDIQGEPASALGSPAELMAMAPDARRLLFLSGDAAGRPLVQVIRTRQVRTVRRYALEAGAPPHALLPGQPNPFYSLSRKSLGDWIVELGLLPAETLVRLRQSESRPVPEAAPSYSAPGPDTGSEELLSLPAPPITLPPEADEVLVELVAQAFAQATGQNLHQHPVEIQRLYQRALDWRQGLEQRYAVAVSERLLGRHELQVLISREALLQEVDRRLAGRELPWRPGHRCPLCQAGMAATRRCGRCGFQLEDPQWHARRERLSAECGSELIPGQMLLALPQSCQLLLLNAWHEIISAWDLRPLGLQEPCHAVALPNRNYLVSDRRARKLIELSPAGKIVRDYGAGLRGQDALQEPVMATFYRHDGGGLRLLIVDKGANRVLELDADGTLCTSWGPESGLDLLAPREVQRTWEDSLLICDTGRQRVLEIERSGRVLASWAAPAMPLKKPVLARRELNGDTLIVDAGSGRVLVYDAARQLRHNFVYWPPSADPRLAGTPAPERLQVLGRDLLALSRDYWMQISVPLELLRWVKPWTGDQRRQRLQPAGEAGKRPGLLQGIPFLKDAAPELLALLEQRLQPLEATAGTMLLNQGELGSQMYFLIKGQVEVLKQSEGKSGADTVVASLGPGQLFGEMALILSEPRSASVRARSDCKLLLLERADFNAVIEAYPEVAERLRKLARERKALLHGYQHQKQQEVMRKVKARMAINKLRELSFFADAEEPLLEALADAMRPVAFMPRHQIFARDESGETMYFITRGQVQIMLEGEAPVASLGVGDVFGEMALLHDQGRSAAVRSDSYCQCFELDRGTFEHVSGSYPGFVQRLRELARQRSEANTDLLDRARAAAEAAAKLKAELASAAAQAHAELDAAFAGAEITGKAPQLVCHLPGPDQLTAIDGEGRILWRSEASLGLFRPGRAHAGDETIWICDTGNDRVLAIDAESHALLREWGDHLLTLAQPRSAVPTAQGNLLIADEGNQRLVLIGPGGDLLWEHTTPHEIMSPWYAEQTATGTVLFADRALHMVYELDPRTRQVIWSYGQLLISGDGPGELTEPACVRRLANGSTLIADTGNDRLLLLSPQGQLLRSFYGSESIPLQQPLHCEPLPTGEVLVWSETSPEVVRLDLAGEPSWRARLPEGAISDPLGV